MIAPEIDKAIREIITRAGAVAKDPMTRGETRTLAAAIVLLGVLADEQRKIFEARIAALESKVTP